MKAGKTLKMRQAFKDNILSLTSKDVVKTVNEILIPQIDEGTFVSFASKDLLEKDEKKLDKKEIKILKV